MKSFDKMYGLRGLNSLIKPAYLRLLFLFLLACLTTAVRAQGLDSGSIEIIPNNTTVNANLNGNVVSTNSETVTFGLPFAACTLIDTDDFTLYDETDTEVPVFVKTILEWPDTRQPCAVTSVRAIKVQFVFDATGGAETYTWDLDGRTTASDITESAVSEIAHDDAIKGGFMEPRVFAINDPDYLVQSGLMPPTAAITTEDFDTIYYPEKFDEFQKDFEFNGSTGGNWLFDRVSTNYRQAMRTGNVEHYRESYVSHEFWVDKIEITGANTGTADFCLGGFDYGGKATQFSDGGDGCDTKYIYSQPIKLHTALTGDDSWEPSENGVPSSTDIDTREEVIFAMVDTIFVGDNRCPDLPSCQFPAAPDAGFVEAYDDIDDDYNERKSGLGLQTILSACQLTLDPTICGHVDTAINNIHAHQTSNPDGRGNFGYLGHSWSLHEGNEYPYLGILDQDYTGATSIDIRNTVEDGPGTLVIDNAIRLDSPNFNVGLTAVPTDNLDGTWTLTLADPVTGSDGDFVRSLFEDIDDPDFDELNFDLVTDRAFSPWMQSMVADGVWEYYHWTDNATQKQKAADLLLGFAQAVAAYAPDQTRLDSTTQTLVENAFGVTIFDSSISGKTGCGLTISPYPKYSANDLMAMPDTDAEYMRYMRRKGSFSDQHTPEFIFQLALGIFFETDQDKKEAMQALATDALEWFELGSCTAGQGPLRSYGWQLKPDPFGTLEYISSFAVEYTDPAVFTESGLNDGSMTGTVTIDLGGAKFSRGSGDFVLNTDYTITGLPAGLAGNATLTAINNQQASLTLGGNAASHAFDDGVDDITLTFLDAAFADFEAARLEGFVKNDIAIEFLEPELVYNDTIFLESTDNDGSIDTSIVVDLVDDTFTVTSGNLDPATDFDIVNPPPGIDENDIQIAIDADGDQATISFTASATLHGNAQDETGFGILFTNAAFTISAAADIRDTDKDDLSILFFEPALAYDSTTFNEDGAANDGSIVDTLTVTVSDDTIVDPGGGGVLTAGVHYNASNIPASLTVKLTRTSATTVSVELEGTADSHGNAAEATDNDLTISFLPAALTTTTNMTNVANATVNTINVLYVEPALSYDGTTFNEDTAQNNGSIANVLTVTLSDDTFVNPGGAGSFTEGVHFSSANLPVGTSAKLTRTSATTVTVELTGNALIHGNAAEALDNDLTINFLAAAFTNTTNVAGMAQASVNTINVLYLEPALAYGGMVFSEDASSNNGSFNGSIVATLSEDTFVVSNADLVLNTHYTVANLPAGLNMVVSIDGTGTQATITLTGMAVASDDINDIMNLELNFLAAAFTTSANTSNLTNANKLDLGLDFFDVGLNYDFSSFVERSDNDGVTDTVLNITLIGDTFSTVGVLTENTHYTVANLPLNLAPLVTTLDAGTATFALVGTALASAASDSIDNVTLTFLDAAFFGGDASGVANSNKNDLSIVFVDPTLSFGSEKFREAPQDNGTIGNTLPFSLTVDTFTVLGSLVENTHYTIANVPDGLALEVIITGASSGEVRLNGVALSHNRSAGIDDLNIVFLDAAFNNGDASEVTNSNTNLQVDFIEGEEERVGDDMPGGIRFDSDSGESTTFGTLLELIVSDDQTINNTGTLVDLQNFGDVRGGNLRGEVTNHGDASLADVTLEEGTVVNGGRVSGSLAGSGTLENVIVDVSSIEGTVVIGPGSRITTDSASQAPGIDLTAAAVDESGNFDLEQPLLVDSTSGMERSALDVIEEEINELFGNSSTSIVDNSDDGDTVIDNPDLDDAVVVAKPNSIETTDESDGVRLNQDGDLVIVSNGLKTTFVPAAADASSFQGALDAIQADGFIGTDGLVGIEFNGNSFTFVFSFVSSMSSQSSSVVALSTGGPANFVEQGSISDRANYRVIIQYADGSSQVMVPYVHDKGAFRAWIEGAGLNYSIGLDGIITITDEGVVVFRGIPDYLLLPPVNRPADVVNLNFASDRNGDGIPDLFFDTSDARQTIYGIN